MILRVCILWLMTLALALPGYAAMPGPGKTCPSQREITCEIPREIAAIPSQQHSRSQVELPCLWKATLAEVNAPLPPYQEPSYLALPQNDRELQGLSPSGLERPPRGQLA